MNQEQLNLYLSLNGTICPFCKSENIGGGDFDTGNTMVFLPIRCDNCGKEWTDEYTLTGVTETE
jgi:predicted Zn-ribbon and HTH transcriptional regulator